VPRTQFWTVPELKRPGRLEDKNRVFEIHLHRGDWELKGGLADLFKRKLYVTRALVESDGASALRNRREVSFVDWIRSLCTGADGAGQEEDAGSTFAEENLGERKESPSFEKLPSDEF